MQLDVPPRPWLHIAPEMWSHGAGGPAKYREASKVTDFPAAPN